MRASEPEPGALISVVLAAGRGRRLGAFASDFPKALLPVLGRPLLVQQLDALRALGVRRVVVVVGHLGERIRLALGDGSSLGLALEYVEQPEPRGIAHALACAAPCLTSPFLCLLGDVAFEPEDLGRVATGLAGADAAIGVRHVTDGRVMVRNFAVERDAEGRARAVEEKPREPRPGWMGTGIYAFRPDFLSVARATPTSSLRGEQELTDAIQRYILGGARVNAVPCQGPDFNLSGPADLLAANLHALERSGRTGFVAPGAEIEAGAELERAIVLEGAHVARGARLRRVLVFPGERVPPGDYVDALFWGGRVVAFPGWT